MSFREEYLYTFHVNQYLERNEPILKRIHSEYIYAGKYCMSPNDAILFVMGTGGLHFIKERTIMR